MNHKQEVTLSSYFFANRNTHWFLIGISITMTCLFSPYLFGLTSSINIMLPVLYSLITLIMLFILYWFVAPLYLKTKINTISEYFEIRFNRKCKFFLSGLYILYNISIRLIIILSVGSLLIKIIPGADTYSTLLFFLLMTGIYTMIGGLKAEIYANIVQIVFIIVGLIGFFIFALNQNEFSALSGNRIASSFFNSGYEHNFSITGILFGLPVIGFWFWCADQFIIQKVLSTQNIFFIKRGIITAAFLQILPIVLFIVPGVVVYFKNDLVDQSIRSVQYAGFAQEGLQEGIIISLSALLMAALASLFNSTSILITFDFYKSLKPSSSDRKLVLVGRLTTMFLLFCSILLIPLSQNMDFGSCLSLLETSSFFVAMVAAIFFTGLINNKITGEDVLYSLYLITTIILLRILIGFFNGGLNIENPVLNWFVNSEFLGFSAFVFVLTVVMLYIFGNLIRMRYAIKK